MKSKISFFNKTIFWKNVTLYWPIWGIYTLVSLIQQPIILWLCNITGSMMANGYTKEQRFNDLISCLYFEPYVVLIAFGALITGMALYSYLYNQKSANMIHSLPVDRTQLFGTTLISGWAFLIAPLFLTAVATSIICAFYGISGYSYVWSWFICVACLAFIAFGIVSICALFTGHIVVLPMYTFVLCYMSWLVYYFMTVIVTTFGFGVTILSGTAETIATMLCPPQCFATQLTWFHKYSDTHELIDADIIGVEYIMIYMVIALVFYIAAYVIYRKRKIEQAGDFLTVNWVKPIFRAAVGSVGGIAGAMIIREILIDIGLGCGVPVFVIAMLFLGIVCYFAAAMFIKKSFHVFKKRDWLGCGIFTLVLFTVFGVMYGLSSEYEKYTPSIEDIEYAEVQKGYEVTLYGEEATAILEIQKDILAQVDYIEGKIESGNRYYDIVYINYKLKNGQYVSRRYPLPEDDERTVPIFEKIKVLEMDEENYLVNTFGKNYDEITVFYGGSVEAYFINPEDRNEIADVYPDRDYEDKVLDETQAKALYEAVIADIKAGTLMKYNVYDGKYIYAEGADVDYYEATEARLTIEWELPNTETNENTTSSFNGGYLVQDTQYQSAVYLSFGPDCENIVNKLIELGIIESAEHIWWGGAEELLK